MKKRLQIAATLAMIVVCSAWQGSSPDVPDPYHWLDPINWPNDPTKFLRGDRNWRVPPNNTTFPLLAPSSVGGANPCNQSPNQNPSYAFSASPGSGITWVPSGMNGSHATIICENGAFVAMAEGGDWWATSIRGTTNGVSIAQLDLQGTWIFDNPANTNTFWPVTDVVGDIGRASPLQRMRRVYVGGMVFTGASSNTDEAGQLTLSAGTASRNWSGSGGLTTAPICTCSDTTAINVCQVVTNTTSLTINGTGTDVINYICHGRT